MTYKIHDSLLDLIVPIDSIIPLPGNPRIGNIDAIAASYAEFGQLKPIVVFPNGDDTYTVIAGNHQTEAAKRLGWTHIAAVQKVGDKDEAIAFALTDNRVSDLGRTDTLLLHEMLNDIVYVYPEVFDALGWDDFELAAIDSAIEETSEVGNGASSAYVPPSLISRPGDPLPSAVAVGDVDNPDDQKFVAPSGMDQMAAVIGGLPSSNQIGERKASFQYSIVFDDGDQMKRWWDFVRWLRNSPAYDGETIGQQMISFIDAHSEI